MCKQFKAFNTSDFQHFKSEEANRMSKQVYVPEDESEISCNTPLPAISSSRHGHQSDHETESSLSDDNNSGDDSDMCDVDLTNVSREEIFEELRRILPLMKDNVTAEQVTYIGSVSKKYRNSEYADELGKHLTYLEFVEAFQRHWKANFNNIVAADSSRFRHWFTTVGLLHLMMNNSSPCSTFCERILEVQLHSDLLDYLGSDRLNPSRMNEEKPSYIVQEFVGILYNVVSRARGARESLRSCNAVEILQPFRECGNLMVSCISLMIQSYLVTEDENEKINSDDKVFKLFVEILITAIHQLPYMGLTFAVIEVLEVLNKLAVNDNNKYRIVNNGALPYYVDLLGAKWPPRVQAEAARGLWILAFKCKDEITKQDGCIEGLKELLENSDEVVRKEAEGALWILEEKKEHIKQAKEAASPATGEDGHIFISYQWDSKANVFKIRDCLKSAGFRVWIDEDDMSGSVLDAMATAVEKASVVIVCLSQKYKESPNCRTEAEYTFRLKKKIVPIRLQSKYYPDGWLGLMVGSKLVLDFSDKAKSQTNVKNLVKELGDCGKDETDSIMAISVPITSALNNPNHEKSSSVKYWIKAEVEKWVSDNNLSHMAHWFSSFNGSLLMEYDAMRKEAPESFFGYLMKNDVPLVDALAISLALKNLQKEQSSVW